MKLHEGDLVRLRQRLTLARDIDNNINGEAYLDVGDILMYVSSNTIGELRYMEFIDDSSMRCIIRGLDDNEWIESYLECVLESDFYPLISQ